MPPSEICKRCFSTLLAVVAMSGSLARAEEKTFHPRALEFKQRDAGARTAASKSQRRARKAAATPSRPSDSPASHPREEETPPAGWSGIYGGVNAGAAAAGEK